MNFAENGRGSVSRILCWTQRRYEIVNIPHDFFAYQCASTHVIQVMTPYGCCFEAKKLRDPQRFTSLSSSVLTTNHNHTGFIWGSTGFTLENHSRSLLCKVYGNKSDDSAVLSMHDALVPPLC